MNKLILSLAISLGLFVLWTSASKPVDGRKYLFKGKLPIYFNENGELRCPGSNLNRYPRHKRKMVGKNLLKRFHITVATRFRVLS